MNTFSPITSVSVVVVITHSSSGEDKEKPLTRRIDSPLCLRCINECLTALSCTQIAGGLAASSPSMAPIAANFNGRSLSGNRITFASEEFLWIQAQTAHFNPFICV